MIEPFPPRVPCPVSICNHLSTLGLFPAHPQPPSCSAPSLPLLIWGCGCYHCKTQPPCSPVTALWARRIRSSLGLPSPFFLLLLPRALLPLSIYFGTYVHQTGSSPRPRRGPQRYEFLLLPSIHSCCPTSLGSALHKMI